MKNTRFEEILQVIHSGKRAEKFSELVNSPFFNKNQRVIRLWNWIRKNNKESVTPGKKFAKTELLDAIEPDYQLRASLADANLRMVLSDFVKLGEIFLQMEELMKGGLESKMRLAEILKSENALKGYKQRLLETEKYLKANSLMDADHYNSAYWVECEKLLSETSAPKPEKLIAADRLADLSWMATKLDGAIRLLLIDRNSKPLDLTGEMLNMIEADEKNYRKNHPVIYSRYLIVKMFIYGNLDENPFFRTLEKYTAKQSSRELQKYNYEAMLTLCRMHDEAEKEYSITRMLGRRNLLAGEV